MGRLGEKGNVFAPANLTFKIIVSVKILPLPNFK
jgi:hypothetical protein